MLDLPKAKATTYLTYDAADRFIDYIIEQQHLLDLLRVEWLWPWYTWRGFRARFRWLVKTVRIYVNRRREMGTQ
jgi:hypothetical protein